ncbi:MAG TPA: hypothetical protein VLV78_09535 [Thermoanaerobaculia bacterium]|nr:hypothetical protein [Thermoanaerobaculia bacterium]
MRLNEPLTFLTDAILAAAAATFGVLLWRRGNRPWAIAFFFTAAGSFLGGTYHGFGGTWIWIATVYCIGLASLFLLLPFLRVTAIAIFLVYAAWMTLHYDKFVWVIVDYGVTMLLLVIVMRSRWMTASLLASIAAAIAQQTPIPFHNDLYHAIQLAGLWLLYRAGVESRLQPDPATG